ncbi:MAG: rod shape-determining protein RodA [Thermoleophilaceae bacterium]|nr:rod shape-determining protein RodA [Thermoleophilaceae bacterium]
MQASPFGTTVKDFRDGAPRVLRFDPLLALAAIGLVACSVYTLKTATADDIPGSPNHYVIRQAIYAGVGIVVMLLVSRIDYSRLRELRVGVYALMIGAIVSVILIGTAVRGTRRSVELPFFTIQPSELGKVLLVVALAGFLVSRVRHLGEKETTSRILLLALFPAMLVIIQPDLGSGLVYVAIAVTLLFVAGTKWTHFAVLGGMAVAATVLALAVAPAVGVDVLKPYQVDRLTAFVSPTDDPREQGYQLKQSITAIGAGQKTGRGDEATQTKLDFLPEHHTDFVFSVVGEEFGFMGAAIVLSLFALLIWRSLRILTMAKNLYGALIAGGVTAMLMFQLIVNAGMTVGLMPITGVPLPLMSYGGSSVLSTFLAIGLLQSVYAQARETQAAKGRELLL